MPFLVLLAQLLCGSLPFLALGYLFRLRLPRFSRALYLIGGVVAVLLFFIWLTEVAGWQRTAHLNELTYNLGQPAVRNYLETKAPTEQTLLFLSLSSRAIYREISLNPERKTALLPLLGWMAEWAANPQRFEQWRSPGSWNRELFFLAHAGILIGHYQIISLDERYNDAWQDIGRYLSTALVRSRYKHLPSRQRDEALRSYDNAAAIYMLRLFDRYFGEQSALVVMRDWSRYIENELYHDGYTLPCAGFSTTNRCRLAPTATAAALLIAYSAEAEAPIAKDFWRAYKHLYKRNFLLLSARFRETRRGEELPRFCENTVVPLQCAAYQNELSQWAAAARGDWLSYYAVHNRLYLRDMLGGRIRTWEVPLGQRLPTLLRLAARLAAETET